MFKFNVYESVQAQGKYCEENSAPHFAPKSGRCWNCGKNIYEPYHWKVDKGMKISVNEDDATVTTGITVDKAANDLVTGCPHCNRSYCD